MLSSMQQCNVLIEFPYFFLIFFAEKPKRRQIIFADDFTDTNSFVVKYKKIIRFRISSLTFVDPQKPGTHMNNTYISLQL